MIKTQFCRTKNSVMTVRSRISATSEMKFFDNCPILDTAGILFSSRMSVNQEISFMPHLECSLKWFEMKCINALDKIRKVINS